MNLEQLFNRYILNDGTVKSFHFEVASKRATVELDIRKHLPKQKWAKCSVQITFIDVTEIFLFEDFPTNGNYSDFTFVKLADGKLYLSLDPYGNSGEPHTEDNWIIKALDFTINELM
jgi:hypothetical protein